MAGAKKTAVEKFLNTTQILDVRSKIEYPKRGRWFTCPRCDFHTGDLYTLAEHQETKCPPNGQKKWTTDCRCTNKFFTWFDAFVHVRDKHLCQSRGVLYDLNGCMGHKDCDKKSGIFLPVPPSNWIGIPDWLLKLYLAHDCIPWKGSFVYMV